MKRKCILEHRYRGFGKHIVVTSTAWCCDKLKNYPLTALIYHGDAVIISIEVGKPWDKFDDVHFCLFCGSYLEMSQQISLNLQRRLQV